MTTANIIKLNQIFGKALVDVAHEAHAKRIEAMKSRPFDEVVEAIKTRNHTGQNKANGYFVSDAISYFDKRLEEEHEDTWMEIEDTTDDNWIKAIECFRW